MDLGKIAMETISTHTRRFSTVEVVQYIGGIASVLWGITGSCSVQWGIPSVLWGITSYCGGCSVQWGHNTSTCGG